MHLPRGGAATPRLGDWIPARPRSTAVQISICDELPSTCAAAGGASVFGDSGIGGELILIMPQRPRACAHRPPTSSMDARGSTLAAAGMSAQRGCMGACPAQAVAVRLPRLQLCGAASREHVLHMRRTAAWSEPTAETCGSIGGTLGSRRLSTVQCTRAPKHPYPVLQ